MRCFAKITTFIPFTQLLCIAPVTAKFHRLAWRFSIEIGSDKCLCLPILLPKAQTIPYQTSEAVCCLVQAEALGNVFRTVMYPRYGPAGGGLLRLHSTYRHDLKIYSSDEGRVQSSAAAFTQGLLDLEGDSLTPILVRQVH